MIIDESTITVIEEHPEPGIRWNTHTRRWDRRWYRVIQRPGDSYTIPLGTTKPDEEAAAYPPPKYDVGQVIRFEWSGTIVQGAIRSIRWGTCWSPDDRTCLCYDVYWQGHGRDVFESRILGVVLPAVPKGDADVDS